MHRQERWNAQRCQERLELRADLGRRDLREPPDASADAGPRLAGPLQQDGQRTALPAEAQPTAEQEMALAAQPLRAALAQPEARWE